MALTLADIYPTFTSINNTSFKKKVHDACVLFAMENYKNLRETHSEDMFPSTQYYTLEEQYKGSNSAEKPTGPPKKKRIPVKKISEKELISKKNIIQTTLETIVTEPVESESSESKTAEKEKRKVYPLIINRNSKLMIDFIINRFLWEVYFIEPSPDEVCPESKSDIEQYILNNVRNEFTKDFNITELIINSVKAIQPSKIITESHGFDKELRIKFGDHIVNVSFTNVVAEYTNDFIKLLMIFFSNRFWFEKSQTINIKIFETIMRYIELSIPKNCKTVSNGLMDEMYQYTKLANPDKTSKDTNSEKDIDTEPDANTPEPITKIEKAAKAKIEKAAKAKIEKAAKAKIEKAAKAKADKAKAEKAKADKAKADNVEKKEFDQQYSNEDEDDEHEDEDEDDEDENNDENSD
jgi:hypothetical protein